MLLKWKDSNKIIRKKLFKKMTVEYMCLKISLAARTV